MSTCDASGAAWGSCEGCLPSTAWSAQIGSASAKTYATRTKPGVFPDGRVVVTWSDDASDHVRLYGPAGDVLWDLDLGPAAEIAASSVDPSGDVIIAGAAFTGSILGAPVTCTAVACGMIAKLDAGGATKWLKILDPGPGQAYVAHVDAAADGRIGVVGGFEGTLDLGAGPVSSGAEWRPVVAELSPAGDILWARDIATTIAVGDLSGAMNAAGELALTGRISTIAEGGGTIDFGDGPVPVIGGSTNGHGRFVAKYTAAGALAFAKTLDGGGPADVTPLALTPAGDVRISLVQNGVFDLGGGSMGAAGVTAVRIVALGPSGAYQWSTEVAEAPGDGATSYEPITIGVAPSGHIWLTGSNPGATVAGASTGNLGSPLLIEHDAGGVALGARTFAGSGWAIRTAIAFTAGGQPVLVGTFSGTVDFGTGALTAAGVSNAFVAVLAP